MSHSRPTLRPSSDPGLVSRRNMLCRIGGGFGALGLASVMADAGALTGMARAESPSEAAVPVDPLAPKPPHFPARAKRVIFLFMNGGPSHVDTFDPKPMLAKYAGQRPKADRDRDPAAATAAACCRRRSSSRKHGQSGIEVSELFPHLAGCVDDLCVIRSMLHRQPEPRAVAAHDELGRTCSRSGRASARG